MASRFNVFSDPTSRVARLLRQMRPSDNLLLLGLAVLVGLSTALALWVFREAIELFHWLFVEQLAEDLLNRLDEFSFAVALAVAGLSSAGSKTAMSAMSVITVWPGSWSQLRWRVDACATKSCRSKRWRRPCH
jgi:hypothetical protein